MKPQNSANNFESQGKGVSENISLLPILSQQLKVVLGLKDIKGMTVKRSEIDGNVTFGFLLPQDETAERVTALQKTLAAFDEKLNQRQVDVAMKGEYYVENAQHVSMPVAEITIAKDKEAALVTGLKNYIQEQAVKQGLEIEIQKTMQISHSK